MNSISGWDSCWIIFIHLNMEAEDVIRFPASSDVDSEKNEVPSLSFCIPEKEAAPMHPVIKMEEVMEDHVEGVVEEEDSQVILGAQKDLIHSPATTQDGKILPETLKVEKLISSNSEIRSENSSIPAKDTTGVKRARMTLNEQEPSVHIVYSSLTRDSKRKLEELLQEWSTWHTKHCSSSPDSKELLSGEETYFPALHVGPDNSSAVSFWVDNQSNRPHNSELNLRDDTVPLYDRAYASALTSGDASCQHGSLDLVDGSRCFNCGSYNHALRDCPKPRDNAAVNLARKQLKTKRNQSSSSRTPTRYYQDTAGGKYDGLRPGVLGDETRKLLGLEELDPPPWLDRMREMGYPPGYLDPDDGDLPSGITIFGDEEIKVETEDGEILETDYPEPPRSLEVPKKMSVEFPGLNAPIPENADERRWAVGASISEPYRNRSHRRSNHSSETSREYSREHRRPRDFRDDGPPGVSPPPYSYPPRYGGYDSVDSFQSPRSNTRVQINSSSGRSMSDWGRVSPAHEDSSSHISYHSSHFPSSNAMSSVKTSDEGRNDDPSDFPSYGRDKRDDYHHHRR